MSSLIADENLKQGWAGEAERWGCLTCLGSDCVDALLLPLLLQEVSLASTSVLILWQGKTVFCWTWWKTNFSAERLISLFYIVPKEPFLPRGLHKIGWFMKAQEKGQLQTEITSKLKKMPDFIYGIISSSSTIFLLFLLDCKLLSTVIVSSHIPYKFFLWVWKL